MLQMQVTSVLRFDRVDDGVVGLNMGNLTSDGSRLFGAFPCFFLEEADIKLDVGRR